MRNIILGIKYVPDIRLSVLRKVFSLMDKSEKILLAIMLGVAIFSGYIVLHRLYVANTTPAPAHGGEYREGVLGQPKLINPLLATSQTDIALTKIFFSGLYKYDKDYSLVPDIADSFPEISANQKEYIVHLKKNAKWHNKEPLTADDVVFTIETIKDPDFKSPYRSEWSNTTIEKIDDYTVKFTNQDTSGPFIHNLTTPLISKKIWDGVSGDDFQTSSATLEAVGSGPYLINAIEKQKDGQVQTLIAESFDDYYGGRPNVRTIEFIFYENYDDILNALHSREITGFGFLPFDRTIYLDKDRKNLNVHELPLPQYQAAFLNVNSAILSDRNVRSALSIATDRQQIIDEALNGYGRLIAGPIMPEQAELGEQQVPSFDLETAKKLLDNAGWKVGQNGIRVKNDIPLELSVATSDFSANVKITELLVANWKSLGVKSNVNILPTQELTDNVIRPRKFDVLVFSHKVGADPDPFVFWHSSQVTNPGLNLTGFNSTQADTLLAEARTTTNKTVRDEKYRQFQALIIQDVPAIFLNQSIYIYALDAQIQGFHLEALTDPTNRFYDVTNWYIDQKRVWKK